jgi:hypothetical protein
MKYKLELMSLDSRRGKYTPVILESNPLIWTPEPLDTTNPRHQDVIAEIYFAQIGNLTAHKYWLDEPKNWVYKYQNFYQKLFNMEWLHNNEDRHSIVVCPDCCLTLVQYHNHRLIAYSRSTDMRNGYFSDKLVLDYLAECITKASPNHAVNSIEWYLAIPHVYNEKGIARLLDQPQKKREVNK